MENTIQPVKIKICGLTSPQDAECLNQNRVDYAGFVLFYEKSKRNISIEKAKEIMAVLNPQIKRVAVVVSPDKEQARQIAEVGFDFIQIHGELNEGVTEFLPVLKAFHLSDLERFETYQQEERIVGYVFDAASPGSGKTFDWNLLKNLERGDKLFVLAGGLHEENVREAIKAVHPDAVDVSSGVEYSEADRKGKDPGKVERFVRAVRETYR